ncbi:MAG TPA: biotin/lipoyl-containing protein [Candidatus Eisenbacteria bacterium]|nr:biotin/lipoyl-containing protein [Candidatus Eisenbacteria bacterium]
MSRRLSLRWGAKHVETEVAFRDGRVTLTREGRTIEASYRRDAGRVTITAGTETRRAATAKDARGLWVSCRGRTWLLVPEGREGLARAAADAPDEIRAPMTGRVVSVAAAAGSSAKEGDLLLTIEAMKMEFKLTAPEDGEVLEVACAEGDRVELGQLLVRIKPAAPAGSAT